MTEEQNTNDSKPTTAAKKTTAKSAPAKKAAPATKAAAPKTAAKSAPAKKAAPAKKTADPVVTSKTEAEAHVAALAEAQAAAAAEAQAATTPAGSSRATSAVKSTDEQLMEGPLGSALGAIRTPIYAYVGVNDLAIEAVSGLVSDLRRRAEEVIADAQRQVAEVPEKVQSVPEDVSSLISRFRPEELRKVAEAYVSVAAGIYNGLAARGEDAVSRLREENPQIEAGLQRLNSSVERVADTVESQVELGEEALGKVARQTRSIGVRAADRVSVAAHDAADTISDAAQATADTVDDAALVAMDEIETQTEQIEDSVDNSTASSKDKRDN